jgi:nucleotide-binding universal stress UspA family protein
MSNVHDAMEQDEKNGLRNNLGQPGEHFNVGDKKKGNSNWSLSFSDPVRCLIDQASSADIVVVGCRVSDGNDRNAAGAELGAVLMGAGRPVLVVPPQLSHLNGKRIVVAWTGNPEVRRAVSASLPFIRAADNVFVAIVGVGTQCTGVQDMMAELARHGATASVHVLRNAGLQSDQIIEFAITNKSDLIVMGAYGHSRLRERMVGDVTCEMLDRTPICCLMSC